MSTAALAAVPLSGDSAECAGSFDLDGTVLLDGDRVAKPAFEFALMPRGRLETLTSQEPSMDRLIDALHRHSHDPESIRQAAGAMRHTIETALWQSARSGGGRLPQIHAEVFGRAAGLFVASVLRSLATTGREWLVMLSSPRRLLWAAKAAWSGDEVAESIREKAGWHSVDEIAISRRDESVPIVRVGSAVAADEDDWLASNPVFSVTRRYQESRHAADEFQASSSVDELPVHTVVVVGDKAEIAARITGHAPLGLRDELSTLCAAADEILGDFEAGRSEWVFRLKQLATPALKKTGPEVARQFWNPVVILTVFLTAGAVLLGSAGVEHLRWAGVVNLIDAEPGIVILSNSSAWGHRQIELLRDPQARSVTDLLLQFGCDPAAVAVHERPFLSAEKPLKAARDQTQRTYASRVAVTADKPASEANPDMASEAMRESVLADVRLDLLRTTLDLPGDLHLTLSGGVLAAHGALSEPAYTRLVNAPRKLGWLKKVQLDQVRDVTGENIEALWQGLEKHHIEFVPASAILPEASKLRLQSVASEMNLLAADARLKQSIVRVQFCASNPQMDAGTIESRVRLVRRDLERQGVPAAWFQPAMDVLDAPGPHTIAFRINLESPTAEP